MDNVIKGADAGGYSPWEVFKAARDAKHYAELTGLPEDKATEEYNQIKAERDKAETDDQ